MSKQAPQRPSSAASGDDLAVLPPGAELPEAAASAPPDWIKVAPGGDLKCRDGRTYRLDPKALVARFAADKVEIPVDVGHATVSQPSAPAIAWIDRLDARPDGLWAYVREWLQGGKDVLAARTHRYVSPAFHHDDKGPATWLHSVALVAAPALAMGAVLHANRTGGLGPDLAEFATALGLDEGASRATCLAAVVELATTAVPLTIHEQALATLVATRSELATLKATVRAGRVEALVEGALKAMKIVPAERAEYVALCATEAGLAGVERLLATMAPKIYPSGLEGRSVERGGPRDRTPQALAEAATALLKQRSDKGLRSLSYADAMARVVADPDGA